MVEAFLFLASSLEAVDRHIAILVHHYSTVFLCSCPVSGVAGQRGGCGGPHWCSASARGSTVLPGMPLV